MRALALALLILASPLQAQDAAPNEAPNPAPAPAPPAEEGWSLVERGARMLLDGLVDEMEPALDEMGRALSEIEPALREMEPALRELMTLLGDLRYYAAPQKLPNGDILIRRKSEAELRLEGLAGPDIEL